MMLLLVMILMTTTLPIGMTFGFDASTTTTTDNNHVYSTNNKLLPFPQTFSSSLKQMEEMKERIAQIQREEHIRYLIAKYPKSQSSNGEYSNLLLPSENTLNSWINVFSLFGDSLQNFKKPLIYQLLENYNIHEEDLENPGTYKYNPSIPISVQNMLDLFLYGKMNSERWNERSLQQTPLEDYSLDTMESSSLQSPPSPPSLQQHFTEKLRNDLRHAGASDETIHTILEQVHSEISSRKIQLSNSSAPANNCDKRSVYVGYDSITYVCNGTVVSKQVYENITSNNTNNITCYTNTTAVYACICPLDKVGSDCKSTRKFQCSATMLTPILNCTKSTIQYGGISLDGDFPCLIVNSTDLLAFSFRMKCQFTEKPDFLTTNSNLTDSMNVTIISTNQNTTIGEIRNSFKYFFKSSSVIGNDTDKNPSFALYTPISKNFTIKFYNFNRLSDSRGMVNKKLDRGEYYVGNETIYFPLFQPSTLPSEFFAGQRLYGEVGYLPNEVDGLQVMSFIKIFIDFEDRKVPEYVDYTNLIIGIVVPFGSILVISILVTIIGVCYYKKMKEKSFLKAE
ncbi:hypothetical protein FDP41_011450 [Naegleria fowleri]|uniref:Uncharacterized protein n=1 Tax=Naegleria fowleri TaxID=5763 RepID=A0A6A5C9Z8_NAEFO|nr:uncharacterized protein FDP41_011450 [Naegleria fowleri]KAF0982520.1 hypothetical protein FDP41_011450 [Naegleria fowleri]